MMLSQPSSSSSSSCRPLLSPIYFVCSVRLGGGGGGGWGGRAGEGAALCLASAAADNIQPWNVTSEPQMTLTLERRENTLEVRSAHSHSHNHIVLETVLFFLPPHFPVHLLLLFCTYFLSFLLFSPGRHHYPWSLRGRGSLQGWQALGRRPNLRGAARYNEHRIKRGWLVTWKLQSL